MTRYDRVVAILDQSIGGPAVNIGAHGPFWRGLSRDQFVAKKVFGYSILLVGSGSASNLVKALKGEAPFGSDLPQPPPGAQYPRMPDGFPPVGGNDIAFIQKWIDDGCPEDPFALAHLAETVKGAVTLSWRPTNAPTASSRYDDLWFNDPDHGWGVNSNGQILYTADGGMSWQEQFHNAAVYMRCVAFASPTRGWVGTITEGQILFETKDGGKNWTPVSNLPLGAPVAICGMWVVNESVVYAAGSNHPEQPVRMMKTTDGGRSWTVWDMRPWADNLIDVYFTTADCGWVVGGRTDDRINPGKPKLRPVVLYTEDGGLTWVDRVQPIRDQFPLGEWGWKIHFLNDRTGFISLQNYDAGAILATSDRGLTWVRRRINDSQMNANLEGIGFIDEKTGWVGGWGDRPKQKRTSSATLDGGLTWRDANEIGRTINRFRFLGNPPAVGYAAGETVYKYAPTLASADPKLTPQNGPRLFDNASQFAGAGSAVVQISVPPDAARFTLRIFDPDGPLVRTLVDETKPQPGTRTLTWDRTDHAGNLLAPRAHIWRATVDSVSESRLVLISDYVAPGLVGPVTDHRKMSAGLMSSVLTFGKRQAPPTAVSRTMGIVSNSDTQKEPRIIVFIRCEREASFDDLTADGIVVNEPLGPIRTAYLPVEKIQRLTAHPSVHRVGVTRTARPRLNVAVPFVGIPPFREMNGLDGSNVVVGIVDSGIDPNHPDFNNRIVRIWDQTISGSGVAEGRFGLELTGQAITASRDTNGHGTHVSGIATGGDLTFNGVAPGASIVFVKTDFNTAHISNGIQYIFRVAAEMNRPAVVNLSLGSHFDSHDGKDDLSELISESTGPGRIVCCAAGNEAEDNIHARITLVPNTTTSVRFTLPNQSPGAVLSGWYSVTDQLEVAIQAPNGQRTPFQGTIPAGTHGQAFDLGTSTVVISTPGVDTTNGDNHFDIQITGNVGPAPDPGTWKLILRSGGTASGVLDVWASDFSAGSTILFLDHIENTMKIGSPGAATEAITVASFTTRASWTDVDGKGEQAPFPVHGISPFSSPGPLRNGTRKPDVAAPGAMIASALSADSFPRRGFILGGGFRMDAGTSMATPFMAGIVALLLQGNRS